MALLLSKETQELIEQRMRRDGYSTPDEVIQTAIDLLDVHTQPMDEETISAIKEGHAQLERGEGMPIEEAAKQLRAKYRHP